MCIVGCRRSTSCANHNLAPRNPRWGTLRTMNQEVVLGIHDRARPEMLSDESGIPRSADKNRLKWSLDILLDFHQFAERG